MVIDPEVLEKEDEYILDRMKEFLSEPDVAQAPAAKNLLAIIERKVRMTSYYNTVVTHIFYRRLEARQVER